MTTNVRSGLGALVDPEYASDHAAQLDRNGERALPAAVGTGGRMLEEAHFLDAKRLRHLSHRAAQNHHAPGGLGRNHLKPVVARERAHRLDVLLACSVAARELLARDRAALRRRPLSLLIDPIERVPRTEIDAHLDLPIAVGGTNARLRLKLALTARNLNPICG